LAIADLSRDLAGIPAAGDRAFHQDDDLPVAPAAALRLPAGQPSDIHRGSLRKEKPEN
jgi:hypothetical protein